MKKLISNKLQCKHCNDIIESVYRHDFKFCSCEKVFVDGGLDYLRRGGDIDSIIDLCEYEDVEDVTQHETKIIERSKIMNCDTFWTKVEDQLPPVDEWCSWWDISGLTEPCTAFIDERDLEEDSDNFEWWKNYTHWIKLPPL